MSMWELEALAEECVKLVHASSVPNAQKRTLYASIYAMVGGFDVSFIHFRNTSALVEADFFFRIDPEQHPEYDARRDELDSIVAAATTHWLEDSSGENEGIYVPEAVDSHESCIWFDASMALWPRAVKAGLLTGLAAEPVEELGAIDAIHSLFKLAFHDVATHSDTITMLHGFVAYLIGAETLSSADERLAEVRNAPELAIALQQPHESFVDERFDARNFLEWVESDQHIEFLEWWCQPYDA
jgi:hypothetical protein